MADDSIKKPVLELARKLKARIKDKEHGGIRGVWERLDPRFKAPEVDSLEGMKPPHSETISWDSFEKAVERLDKPLVHSTYEKMTFGLKGNPILLMNVFEILGIKGFADIANEKFATPDPSQKLFSIEGKIDSLNEQIVDIADKIEVYHKKRSRITALKTAIDFEQVTMRLQSIVENNTDSTSELVNYSKMQKISEHYLKTTSRTIESPDDLEKHNKAFALLKKQMEPYKFSKLLTEGLLSSYSVEDKRVLYFYILFVEYHEYCFFHKLLRSYYKTLMRINVSNGNFTARRQYGVFVFSPLYTSLFYLFIVQQYIKKMRGNDKNKNLITDETTKTRIKKSLARFPSEESSVIKEYEKFWYFEQMTNSLIKQSVTILKRFDPKKPAPQSVVYTKFMQILTQILAVFSVALITGEPSKEEIDNQLASIHTMQDLHNLKLGGIYGRCNLTNDIIDKFDVLLNDLSVLARNTLRDLNG